MDLSNFREEYLKGQLHRKDLAENPFEQFQTWFEQALKEIGRASCRERV